MTLADLSSTALSTRATETPTLTAAGALRIKSMSEKSRLFLFPCVVLNVLLLTTRGQHRVSPSHFQHKINQNVCMRFKPGCPPPASIVYTWGTPWTLLMFLEWIQMLTDPLNYRTVPKVRVQNKAIGGCCYI